MTYLLQSLQAADRLAGCGRGQGGIEPPTLRLSGGFRSFCTAHIGQIPVFPGIPGLIYRLVSGAATSQSSIGRSWLVAS